MAAKMTKLSLTNEDLALAWFACGHAASFWKRKGRSKYCKTECAKYEALSLKLDGIIPHVEGEEE